MANDVENESLSLSLVPEGLVQLSALPLINHLVAREREGERKRERAADGIL